MSAPVLPWLLLRLLLPLLLSAFGPAHASGSPADLISAAEAQNLSAHPLWLKLLHYDNSGRRSEIISPEFFLSPDGAINPQAEMHAVINAYFLPWGSNPDQHPRCRFPARYFWLAQHLALPDYRLREIRCQRLERWALVDRVQSVSVLLISGYFGNPASTFGHSLIKLNTDAPDDTEGLFDLSLNFGALVPENEPTLVYVGRGLFGGYEAGFSDRYFYTQDLVYARTELRDIWDYKLILPQQARTLLVLHIWEIIGKKYKYYFLTQNCAYRLAGLLELATGEKLLQQANVWYVPVQLFHRLIDIDAQRAESGAPRLIDSVRFIPSSQRTLSQQFSRLQPAEKEAANAVIMDPLALPDRLRDFDDMRQGEILDAVLAYYQYQWIAEQPNPPPELQRKKHQVLRQRLRLPAQFADSAKVAELPSPALAPRPFQLGLGLGQDDRARTYTQLRWTAFAHQLASNDNVGGDELVAFDLALGAKSGQGIFLDRADLLRIRKLNPAKPAITTESGRSWELHVGARRIGDREEGTVTEALTRFGIGTAWEPGRHITLYAMASLAAHSITPYARARPFLGMITGYGPWRAELQLGAENIERGERWREIVNGKIQYQLSARQSARFEYSNEIATRLSGSLIWHW